jgi:DNA-binding PadR family transcriptional regulator
MRFIHGAFPVHRSLGLQRHNLQHGGRGHFGGHRGHGEMPWGEHRRGGPRARRGDVRLAVLGLLNEGPANGYNLIGQIAERTQGRWRPSPGSIYPVLGQLAEEGLVQGDGAEQTGFSITDAGKAFVSEHEAEIAEVWNNGRAASPEQEALMESIGKLMGATRELAANGSDAQRAQATTLLDELRRKLYGILAE